MTFNSYSFIFIFLPVFLIGVFAVQRIPAFEVARDTLMKLWLIAMSAFFFVGYGAFSISVFLSSIIWNLIFSYLIRRQSKNGAQKGEAGNGQGISAVKSIAILGNVLLLVFFKFFSEGAMPVAISFYTFSQIMYIAELGRSIGDEEGVLDYLCYILFFPKIMQGPIADYENITKGLRGLPERRIETDNICHGLMLFTMGLVKKVLLADVFGGAVNFGYQGLAGMTAFDALIIAVSYSFQLYFDFSGYCDMAEGICRMLGMELARNFDAPYTAENIGQFWDRWHISLTRFFTKYIYIPLGGSRKGMARTCINILLVFLVSGIWHGNGWNFVVWGMMHGILMVLTRLFGNRTGKRKEATAMDKPESGYFVAGLTRVFHTLLTFLYVTVAWVFFRAETVADALALLGKILNPDSWRGFHITAKFAECFMVDELWYIFKVTPVPRWNKSNYICMWIILVISAWLIFKGKTARSISDDAAKLLTEKDEGKHHALRGLLPVLYGILFVWGVLSLGGVSTFLYVNF